MFGPLFDPTFWFTLAPSALSPSFERAFFVLFAVMILIGAAARIASRYKKGDRFLVATYRKVASLLSSMGILGMIWFFFTYETAYLLGARFWFLLWVIGLVVWSVSLYRYAKVQVPAQKESLAHKGDVNKYLPRKKGK